MRTRIHRPAALLALVLACGVLATGGVRAATARATYLYSLSNFTGTLRYDWVRIHVDPGTSEIYVLYQNLVRIFSPSGMEVFSFGDDLDLGQVLDAAVDAGGNVLLLSFKNGQTLVTRCDFRGVPVGPLEITDVPAGLVFGANRMVVGRNALYFVSTNASSVIVTDLTGRFREHLDLLSLVDAEDKQKVGAEIIGFAVDGDDNLYFTVPVLFRVYKLSADRTLTSFGRPGSGPGRFGVLGGVATDSQGHVLVADKLRCVVMVFDRDFTFLTEFGYRGARPDNLVIPDDIAVDQRDRVYVSQGRRRGVSVFALTGE